MNDRLNRQQRLALEHRDGPMLVVAGAGSGKTRVITERVVYLIEQGIPQSAILALTFTNKAADEMRLRIEKRCHLSIDTFTFHALGARILRESIDSLGRDCSFAIYDQQDSWMLIKRCLIELGDKGAKENVKKGAGFISARKNRLIAPVDRSEEGDECSLSPIDQLWDRLYLLYQARLLAYNALDFDDLIYLTASLLRSCPEVLARYQRRWQFMLVDEYQDINTAQYAILKLLASDLGNLFIVGDPDQSIYSWRGANRTNFLHFNQDFPNAQVVVLEQNYRSTQTILSAANAVIGHNAERQEKKLWSSLGAGEPLSCYRAASEFEEARWIVSKIKEARQQYQLSYGQMAIFYRTNSLSRSFEDALLSARVPYLLIGGFSFYQRKEIKDMIAFLRMIVSESDFISFARTINIPKRGFGKLTLNKLGAASEQLNIPILSLCRQLVERCGVEPKLTRKQGAGLAEYLQLIDRLKRAERQQTALSHLIETVLNESSYLKLLRDDPDSFEDRQSNLSELVNKAAQWSEFHQSNELQRFLEELTLISVHDDLDDQEDGVKLMTLHNSKGLEFDFVCIAGVEEGLLPHINSQDEAEQREEERRLFYVGMTRAKKYLCLTHSAERFIWGMRKQIRPSRFLKEIPDNYLHWPSPDRTFSGGASRSGSLSTCRQEMGPDLLTGGEDALFQPGQEVVHPTFGKGEVVKSYQSSLGQTYEVYFPQLDQRYALVARYAQLSLQN